MIFSIRVTGVHLRWSLFALLFPLLAAVPALNSENTSAQLSDRQWAKLLRQAQHGNPRAQTLVGIAFQTGDGVKTRFF
jgi:hypothetical protein